MEVSLSKSFSARAVPTKRALDVAGMFGIGVLRRRFVVVGGLSLSLGSGQVVYITGQSGSGKSLILRLLRGRLGRGRGPFRKVVDLADVTLPAGKPLVDCFEAPLEETLRLLSIAGLNDAFLFLRTPEELSDGQRYRLRLAMGLAEGADCILIDEFCSTLDRVTARIIAHSVRKYADRTGTTFIVATAHDDLFEDLQPNLYIEKHFGPRAAVREYTPRGSRRRTCTVLKGLRIEEADRSAWEALRGFHYRGHRLGPYSHIFAATLPGRGRLDASRRVVGVIVYAYPALGNRLRNRATGGRYLASPSRRENLRRLNREVRTISRVVVDPQYRGLGLAVRLVRETMPRVGTPYVEALARMGRVNPFFERAGMTRYETSPPRQAERLIAVLERCAVPREVAGDPEALERRLEQLPPPRRRSVLEELHRWYHCYQSARTSRYAGVDDRTVIRTAAANLFGNPVYYLWRNPEM